MLKRVFMVSVSAVSYQPPSGGCVLKPALVKEYLGNCRQPPSGGCVLKRVKSGTLVYLANPSRLQAAVC